LTRLLLCHMLASLHARRALPPFPTRRSSDLADACASAGVALVGGETAEHPGLLGVDEYDVAGAATGVAGAHLLGSEQVGGDDVRSEEHTSELQSRFDLVCRLLLENKTQYQLQ